MAVLGSDLAIDTLTWIEDERVRARDEALEEAAKIAEGYPAFLCTDVAKKIAGTIRAAKSDLTGKE